MEPRHGKSWLLNLLLFRAYHDALIFSRRTQGVALERQVMPLLASREPNAAAYPVAVANGTGAAETAETTATTLEALQAAIAVLRTSYFEPAIPTSSFGRTSSSTSLPNALNVLQLSEAPSVPHLYGRLMALAALLFAQIGHALAPQNPLPASVTTLCQWSNTPSSLPSPQVPALRRLRCTAPPARCLLRPDLGAGGRRALPPPHELAPRRAA